MEQVETFEACDPSRMEADGEPQRSGPHLSPREEHSPEEQGGEIGDENRGFVK
jgi:hypothetical protein